MGQTESRDALLSVAQLGLEAARASGAQQAAVRAYRAREVEVRRRDGRIEQLQESITRGISLELYVDGRYAAVASSDLRPEALRTFITESVDLTRRLAPDPFRALPDPALCAGQARVDLALWDAASEPVSPARRLQLTEELEAAARAQDGAGRIISVATAAGDARSESVRVHSDGFSGAHFATLFSLSAEVSVRDREGCRPEEWSAAAARHLAELPPAAAIGAEAARRALSRLGAAPGATAVMAMAVENRAAGQVLAALLGPLSAQALQQKRSFLEGRVGERVGSPLLHVDDDPLVVKGFGSRLYDGEGLAARIWPIFDAGRLRNYYVDTYYGKKLGLSPTTAGASNIVWRPGRADLPALLKEMKEGVLVTGFLGGNSNPLTGDFSLGIQGLRVRGGEPAEPFSGMNLSGNQLELWPRLVAVGNDPYRYSSYLTPTLVFDAVQLSGV